MNDPIKITSLQLENVKRVRAVSLTPSVNGLTVLGGGNGQGKTSVLDAIAWALGGDKYRPDAPERDGSVLPPSIHITLSNGLVVERKGKNSALTVTDPTGKRYGQTLLNEFVGQFAIDLPRFLDASDKEKAEALLRLIGVGDQVRDIETRERQCYERRHAVGQLADQKAKYAKEMLFYPDMPDEPVSAMELIRQQQDVLLRNAENQRKREQLCELKRQTEAEEAEIDRLTATLEECRQRRENLLKDIAVATKDALELHDESTAELEEAIIRVDDINRKVRANLDKQKAMDDAQELANQYNTLTVQIENLRQAKRDLLNSAPLPLPELTVEGGRLLYRGHTWGDMSGSEQLMVGAAIARAMNPRCGFILMDKLEQLDADTLRRFGQWLQEKGLQAIATRVSTGEECTVIIEDGQALGAEAASDTEMGSKPPIEQDGSRGRFMKSDKISGKTGSKTPWTEGTF